MVVYATHLCHTTLYGCIRLVCDTACEVWSMHQRFTHQLGGPPPAQTPGNGRHGDMKGVSLLKRREKMHRLHRRQETRNQMGAQHWAGWVGSNWSPAFQETLRMLQTEQAEQGDGVYSPDTLATLGLDAVQLRAHCAAELVETGHPVQLTISWLNLSYINLICFDINLLILL